MKILKLALILGVAAVAGLGADMAWQHRDALRDAAAVAIASAEPASEPAAAPPPAMPVPTAPVVKKTVPVVFDYAARTEAIRAVDLQAKVGGYVAEQLFPDGADVEAGALLYRLDGRDYEAALMQARALADREAAALDYARATSDRSASLVRSGSLAKDTADLRVSTRRQAEAALAVSRAAIRSAELNLGYTEIRAPFAGRLSRDRAPVGTLIGAGGATLNRLVQLDPIYVTFNPSETELAEIAKARSQGRLSVAVSLPGGGEMEGELSFVDNAVDPRTGTVSARATIRNEGFRLLPGQYVRARLKLREEPGVLMVPSAAVGSGQLGKYVYVIGRGDTVEQKTVRLGRSVGDLVAAEGVSESDRIITGNLQKIGVGMPVEPLPPTLASN